MAGMLESFKGQNENPDIFDNSLNRRQDDDKDEDGVDLFDTLEVFDMIRDINDPEHPLTLEQLHVLQLQDIRVDDKGNRIEVLFTPTIPHCSASTLIGLSIRLKLLRSLPSRFKIDIRIAPGKHLQEEQINKQLNDKERVCAAIENASLLEVVNKCLSGPGAAPALA